MNPAAFAFLSPTKFLLSRKTTTAAPASSFFLYTFAYMEKIYNYYQNIITVYTRKTDRLKKKIHLLGSIRLLLVAGLVAMIWFFKSEDWKILAGIVILFVFSFIVLMVWHTKLFARKSYAEALTNLCKNELNGLNYNFSAFDGAPEKNDTEHSFSLDLDLFGNHSLFQSINRTVSFMGKEKLADWFLQPLNDKTMIIRRQEAICELAALTQLRQHFYVTGILQPEKKEDLQLGLLARETVPCLANKRIWKLLIYLIPSIWVIITIGYALNLLPISTASMFFGFSFIVAYLNTKQIAMIHSSSDKVEQTLQTYSTLIKCIEDENFQSAELADIHKQFTSGGQTASSVIKKLSSHIAALNQRFSAIGVILNIFTLRDTRMAIKLEKWNMEHQEDMKRWFEALASFDAYCSLGGFAFNHPEYIYPKIAESYFKMEGKALGHPLIHRNVCVKNDIDIRKSPWFLIITGANMAGKSTYLRTIGINYLLGCIGAPVCAASLTLYPAKLMTSLRTSDSLASNESYFFAELKRLKMIIDRLQQGEKLFIILDEILKGTNSIDKQKGSLALMKQLIANHTCGIIATHDLVLGELEQEFPNQIKNYRFEADILNNELTFSYRLREGIAQNMNACFLMKKMGITV